MIDPRDMSSQQLDWKQQKARALDNAQELSKRREVQTYTNKESHLTGSEPLYMAGMRCDRAHSAGYSGFRLLLRTCRLQRVQQARDNIEGVDL